MHAVAKKMRDSATNILLPFCFPKAMDDKDLKSGYGILSLDDEAEDELREEV